jgi:hypothetical protein
MLVVACSSDIATPPSIGIAGLARRGTRREMLRGGSDPEVKNRD